MSKAYGYRGDIFYFKQSASMATIPAKKELEASSHEYVYIQNGLLVVESGKVSAVGEYAKLKHLVEENQITDYQDKLITPGFIDTHNHATQSSIVASYGDKLLEWLNNYVFPAEQSYVDSTVAREDLNFFIDNLLKNGTTTAVSYGPLFLDAADIFFELLSERNLRFITGNVLMDRNAPESLTLSTQTNYDNSKQLLSKWHQHKRLSYCISPRFALACSNEMLELAGALKAEYPSCYMQTHLDENHNEIAQVRKDFPWSKHYLDVYHRYGLVTDRSVFGHCIHTTEEELALFQQTNAIISWCPLSNNFLGSGLFDFQRASQYTDKITLATDWGAGNSLSMFAVLDDAYKVSMLNSVKLPSMLRWYMATLGAAKALQLDEYIGSFDTGKEADFIVIDPRATPFLKYRMDRVEDIYEMLFVIMTLGSEANITATYVAGKLAFSQTQ